MNMLLDWEWVKYKYSYINKPIILKIRIFMLSLNTKYAMKAYKYKLKLVILSSKF